MSFRGDINIDGKFNVSDVVILTKYLVKNYPEKVSEQGGTNADMNDDDKLNVFDLIAMRRNVTE
jgi:hypothetical protein